jgi:hypothetical protein
MKKNNKTNRKHMKYQQGHHMEETLYRMEKKSGSFEQFANEWGNIKDGDKNEETFWGFING